MCAKMLQSCLTLRDPMDCSPPGSSVHGTLPARILEWVAMPSSRGSSWPRDWTGIFYVSCTGGRVLHHWCHQGSPYLLLLTFALSAVEAIQPPDEICMLWEARWIRRAPWDQELNCTSCSARGEGRLRQRHFHDFQGPNQERGGGVFLPAPAWPGLWQWVVTGRNREGCLPPASVSHRKTNPATSWSWR